MNIKEDNPCTHVFPFKFRCPDKIVESPHFFAISLFFIFFSLDILTFFHTFVP